MFLILGSTVMKSFKSVISLFLLLIPFLRAGAELPVLEAGVYINDGGTRLNAGLHAAPEVVDWNNDGKKDLLVGVFTNGEIWYFENQGTDASPSFNGHQIIYSSGTPIRLPYG